MITHKCTACSCEYTDDEGGIQGFFGMLLISFCPTCLSCMCDMAEQLIDKEWVGLTDEEVDSIYAKTEKLVGEHWDNGGTDLMFPSTLYKAIEAELKDKNS